MRDLSVFTNDTWFALRQLITRGKADTLDRSDKAPGSCFTDVAHSAMPEIHSLSDLDKESCFDRRESWEMNATSRKNNLLIC